MGEGGGPKMRDHFGEYQIQGKILLITTTKLFCNDVTHLTIIIFFSSKDKYKTIVESRKLIC